MGLATLLDRILGRQVPETSKNAAKDRLRLVLMHDRSDIPATMMEAIRTEMIHALSKYVEIDTEALEVQLERDQGAIGLMLNIPIRRVKTEAEAADALAAMHALQMGKSLPAELRERQDASPVEAEVASDKKKVKDADSGGESHAAMRDARDTGELASGSGTGDLVAERAEPND